MPPAVAPTGVAVPKGPGDHNAQHTDGWVWTCCIGFGSFPFCSEGSSFEIRGTSQGSTLQLGGGKEMGQCDFAPILIEIFHF